MGTTRTPWRHRLVAVALAALLGPSLLVTSGTAVAADEETDPTPCAEPTPGPEDDPEDGSGEDGSDDGDPEDGDPEDGESGDDCAEDSETDEPRTGAFEVTDAQFRWGMNNESNNRAYAPGTFNFLSAGAVVNPGKGGSTIDQKTGRWSSNGKRAWRAEVDNVRIEKRTAIGSDDFRLATLAGLRTDPDGVSIPNTYGDDFTDHNVVIDGGTGQVDRQKGTATIEWEGTWSVIYYSGMVFFTVSDPVLSVTPRRAKVTATLGGYKSDQLNPSIWEPMDPKRVVLANLPPAEADLTEEGGFNVTPAYNGVKVRTRAALPDQQREEPGWGSFPQSFVNFQADAGSGPYWYSSGGASDRHKPALPMTFSYSAGAPITPAQPPEDDGTGDGGDDDVPDNEGEEPPPERDPPETTSNDEATADTDDESTTTRTTRANPGAARPAVTTTDVDPRMPSVPVVYALASAEPGHTSSDHPWMWWLGSLLLLGAAALTVLGRFVKGNR